MTPTMLAIHFGDLDESGRQPVIMPHVVSMVASGMSNLPTTSYRSMMDFQWPEGVEALPAELVLGADVARALGLTGALMGKPEMLPLPN